MNKYIIAVLIALTLTGCYDDRYDKCEQQYPLTKDYRACVKRFQDQDNNDAAAMAAVNAANTAAIIVTTIN
ncbi:UNVERIFIED_CONTAM: hypothetical protein RF648_18345 [Kocuria sp. CPCC 205274]